MPDHIKSLGLTESNLSKIHSPEVNQSGEYPNNLTLDPLTFIVSLV